MKKFLHILREKKVIRQTLKGFAILLLLPYFLTVIYAVVPPVSLAILSSLLTFNGTSSDWQSFEKISPNLSAAVISAEDGGFCNHSGVDWKALERSFERYEKRKKMKSGASTIAMQVSKNLYYWFLPPIIRKPLEIPTALWIDLIWSKQRIIEVYMNIAQFGPDIFGAEAAAQHYFKKPASKLTMSEASRLASILPNPEKRSPTKPTAFVKKYSSNIKVRAAKSSKFTDCINDE